MTMTIDNNQQRHHLGSMGFDHLPYSGPPQFNNPWTSSSGSSSYQSPLSNSNLQQYDSISKPSPSRPTTMSIPFSSMPATAPSVGSSNYAFNHAELLNPTHDMISSSRPTYDQSYTTAPSQSSTYAPSTSSYAPISSYGQSLAQQQQGQSGRRISPV